MVIKIRPGQATKATSGPIRQILAKHFSTELMERPKIGFGIPIGAWLRCPLRPWPDDLPNPLAMQRQGYLLPEPIQHLRSQHFSGRCDHTARLWSVLMSKAWPKERGK